jgi:choice-of-anchor B domain-containing protein
MLQRLLVVLALVGCLCATALSQQTGAVRYLGHIIPPQGGSYTAGCWGWTDTTTGREYALLGNVSGTSIVEITNPNALVERDFVPGVSSSWRELQTYQHYAYVVSEGGGGVQIIDLSFLPDSVHLVKSFTYTQPGKSTAQSHTIHIKDGYMYLNGCAQWSPGGIVIFDLADPVNPVYKSAYTRNYVHDCFVRNDTIYAAAIYGVGCDVISATNKTSPQYLYTVTYPGSGTHNTTTADGRYLFTTDEIGTTAKTLKVWDLAGAPTPPKVAEYVGNATAIVHNAFVKDSMVFMSYYTAGIRIVNIADPTNPIEVGGYDSYPANDNSEYTGAWSIYPFFPSGRIVIGDMASGMYVVDVNLSGPLVPSPFTAYSDFTTPTSVALTWTDPDQRVSGAPLSNFKLHLYRNGTLISVVDSGVGSFTDGGRVKHQQYTYTIRVVAGTDSSSLATSQVYAGGAAQPNAPAGFEAVEDTSGNALHWTNPKTQIDGTPLNDFAAVLIYRDGILLDSVMQTSADTGEARSYVDPVGDYHTYSLRVRDNETPRYYSSMTATLGATGRAYLLYTESFDSTLSSITRTGYWDTTHAVSASGGTSLTDSPFGSYDINTVSTATLPAVILDAQPMLQFKHIAIVAFADFAFLEISKNHRASFTVLKTYNMTQRAEWQDNTADPGDWVTQTFDLSAYAGDTVNVRFRLVTNGTVNADGWYIDDIYIGPATGAASGSFAVSANWNLVSLPLEMVDASVATVFPTASSAAYAYANGYSTAESLAMGQGYWLKFPGASLVPLSGTELRRDTIDLAAGWNIIGSITVPVDTAGLKTIPAGRLASPVYGYDAGYSIAGSIEPGKGYWVKASATGKLILNSFVNKVSAAVSPRPVTDGLASFRFSDADGNAQTLYAGTVVTPEVLATCELPPAPPVGAFDARFASGTYAEQLGESAVILLRSARYPVTLQYELGTQGAALLVDGAAMPLSGTGSLVLEKAPGRIALIEGSAGTLPASYALEQNFPNPFNPATEIRFDLPEAGMVSLMVYDLLGREVAPLLREERSAGAQRVRWDASANPSGVYVARLTVTGRSGELRFQSSRKLVLAK